MIFSNKETFRNYFNISAVYTKNTATDIAANIIKSKKLNTQFTCQVKALKNKKSEQWKAIKAALLKELGIEN